MVEEIKAEIVANVRTVLVREGDTVDTESTLVLLESMKMEIPVISQAGGVVTRVAVHVGDVVGQGDLIAVVE